MNYLGFSFFRDIGEREYVDERIPMDEKITMSITIPKDFTFTCDNLAFNVIYKTCVESLKVLMSGYEEKYDFFKPQLVLIPEQWVIKVELQMREKKGEEE